MPSRKDLKNKPLVEGILELRWVLPSQEEPSLQGDPDYQLHLGRFSERVQSKYPFHEPLPSTQIPDSMIPYVAQHRFRTADGAWPLVQMGPGIMTVNETERYTWEDFKSRCEEAINDLLDSQPVPDKLKIKELALRYINAVDLDQESVFDFLRDKMKTTISLPAPLFQDRRVNETPKVFNWQVSFPHENPGGLITLRFATGSKKPNQPALIWEILVVTVPDRIPQVPEGFSNWLTNAHELTDDWFFRLIEGELERRFSSD